MEEGKKSPCGSVRRGTHLAISPSGDGVSVFHDGGVDPRIPGFEVSDSFKATIVDWDKDTGEWFSVLRDGREICRGPSKESVVEEEHRILAGMESRGEEIPKPRS